MWGTLAEVARTLRLVWEEFLFRKLPPFGVDSAGLMQAICCGKLTVAAMVPAGVQAAKSAKATSELRDAVMRAWPGVMAVIDEVHPRDATMQAELLRLGVDAFDARYAGADMVEHLVKPVLKEMQTRFAKYLVLGGRESTWKEVVEVSSEEAMKVFALRRARSRRRRRRRCRTSRCTCSRASRSCSRRARSSSSSGQRR